MPRPPPPLFFPRPNLLLLRRWIHPSPSPPPPPTTAAAAAALQEALSHILTSDRPLLDPSSLQFLADLSLSSSSLPSLLSQLRHLLDTDACNSFIKSYTRANSHLRSLLVFPAMLQLPVPIPPDLDTFPPLLKSLTRLHLPPLGLSLHAFILKSGHYSAVSVATSLLSMYCSFARLDDARRVFDEMPDRNSVTWNAMITGYVHNRLFHEAHELFSVMLRSGVELSEVTVVCALTACSHLGALGQGVWIHNYINSHGLQLNVFVGTALIDMYMKCGVIDEAVNVFRAMRLKNVFSWNALMMGLAMNGEGEAALKAFDEMIMDDIKPDGVSFLALLSACSHQGLVDEGRKIFVDMERVFGVQPRIQHYGCMVDLLGRAGLLEEAYDFIRTMPMKVDATIWRTLLAACRIHRDLRLAELAIRELLVLEPDNGENYILLSNLLARGQRWAEVGKVRQMMRLRGIKKAPGCSSIEVDDVVYEFVVSARRDGLDEILAMLDTMKKELKLAGYCVDTEMVSFDLEEEEKEISMLHHSEKLALAFGLMRTQRGSDIRIVKNLRMCVDCHTFFKFVSKVYQRKIVVRDKNRFHHFADGVCSCRDYW